MNAHPRPYYYLENFTAALDWLRGRYGDLLSDEERRFIEDFNALPTESAALAVRMVMRQGDLFRTSKLRYSEIGCPRRAAAALIELDWVDPRPCLSFANLYRLLRKAELCDAFGLQEIAKTVHKAELVALVGAITAESRPLQEWWPEAPDEIFRVRVAALCERLRLMFFGNFHQNWSEFVLADLGIFRYESVHIDEAARAFQTRPQIEEFHAIYRCRELLHAEAPLEEVLCAVPAAPTSSDAGWIEAKRAKLLFAIGTVHEKAGELDRALEIYHRCRHPQARIRGIRVLERLERHEEAAALLATLQQQPASEVETQLATRIGRRLRRKLKPAASAPPSPEPAMRYGWDNLELELPHPPTAEVAQRVELAVTAHLGTPQAPVLYVENTLLNAIFGLLCWEAIFTPLPGAFFHAFHAAPADLLEPDFHTRRSRQFAACFAQLADGRYRQTILDTFERKAGIQTPFVAWNWLTREQLELALDCIPAAHLRELLQRLLADVRTNRSGLPDLIQLWPAERRYRLIEVKGPGDRLQDNQIRWLSFCVARAIPVCVCKVRWTDPS